MKKKKILCIDSGGIKGLIPAVIINHLEILIQKKTGNKNAKIGDYFNMIAGTSTGGILACYYLTPTDSKKNKTPKYFASEAINLYSEKAREIFTPKIEKSFTKISSIFNKKKGVEDENIPKIISSLNTANNLFTEEYSETGLEKILLRFLGDTSLSETTKNCLVISYDITNCRPMIFSTNDAKKSSHRDFYLRDVARATSAAPTYFKLASIKSHSGASKYLIDGGIFAPNPTLCAMIEANKSLFKKAQKNFIDNLFVVSISTGKEKEAYDHLKAQNWGIAQWAVPVMNIMLTGSSEIVDYQVRKLFECSKENNNYYRIDADLCNAKFDMDDVSKENLNNLRDAALYYIETNAKMLDEIVDKIISL